jgi:sarcosine/dimethylglycine N-methyltransferase
MTDVLDDVRNHYRATGLTERLNLALAAVGPEEQRLAPQRGDRTSRFPHAGVARRLGSRQDLVRPTARVGAAALAEFGRGDGPDFVQLSANLGRNLMEGRLGILTAMFEAASTKT